ncbi:MAG: Cysteine synthase [Fimbriimonadaceae bacterium]|nr:Cysteine synthase [Fimbriimonadaceae bacterium]
MRQFKPCPGVGHTPVIEIDGILIKLECVNRTGSIKDRIAWTILTESRRLGLLHAGQPIIEATSGNTGIALAHYGRQLGYPVTIVMPENMTNERKAIIRERGADLILCSAEGSFAEAAEIRDRIAADRGWFNPDQFSNPLNTECHRWTTGQELLEYGKRIDSFVAGVGTGGTLIGVGQALTEAFGRTDVVAVEPAESAVMSGGSPGPHAIYGIGDGFIPALASDGGGGLHPLISAVEVVSSAEAIATANELRTKHGLCIGISSGANFAAAKRRQNFHEVVATVFADGYMKYKDHGLCASKPGQCLFESRCKQLAFNCV